MSSLRARPLSVYLALTVPASAAGAQSLAVVHAVAQLSCCCLQAAVAVLGAGAADTPEQTQEAAEAAERDSSSSTAAAAGNTQVAVSHQGACVSSCTLFSNMTGALSIQANSQVQIMASIFHDTVLG